MVSIYDIPIRTYDWGTSDIACLQIPSLLLHPEKKPSATTLNKNPTLQINSRSLKWHWQPWKLKIRNLTPVSVEEAVELFAQFKEDFLIGCAE
jgi:hypothetical protein